MYFANKMTQYNAVHPLNESFNDDSHLLSTIGRLPSIWPDTIAGCCLSGQL